jgi:hypothetical protein
MCDVMRRGLQRKWALLRERRPSLHADIVARTLKAPGEAIASSAPSAAEGAFLSAALVAPRLLCLLRAMEALVAAVENCVKATEMAEQRLGEMALARGVSQEEVGMLRQVLAHVHPDTGADLRHKGREPHEDAEHRYRWQQYWQAVHDAAERRRLCLAGEGEGACQQRSMTEVSVQVGGADEGSGDCTSALPPDGSDVDEAPALRRLRHALADVEAVILDRDLRVTVAGGRWARWHTAHADGGAIYPLACAASALNWAHGLALFVEVKAETVCLETLHCFYTQPLEHAPVFFCGQRNV